ncbi:hypothetical protein [Legionella feeleii]|nr:hypothetical protein [Legionella feeleii]
MLKNDLLNNNIDAKSLYQAIQKNDVNELKRILFLNARREFVLYVPFYEGSIPDFFPRSAYNKRTLYLTEDEARKNTPNAAKVKHWLKVKSEVEKDKFEELYKSKKIESKNNKSLMPIFY